MNNWKRTEFCGTMRSSDIDREVVLNGWAHRQRDFGDLVFIDLRDRTGIVQIVVDKREAPELVATANSLRSEFVLSVRGIVRPRHPGTENANLPTGEIEIAATGLEILNASRGLPFQISDEDQMRLVDETLRVKYRYLDLRRPKMYSMLELRHKAIKRIRDYMDSQAFVEIETPLFTKSTPEGARDYLVPYRLEPGLFYALPQSPQQYKQLLMVAGCERYFQIARCFRDEAQRADRLPEFTQLDVEMSFVEQEDVLQLIEGMTIDVVEYLSDKMLPKPFPRLTWDEALSRYGSDKPDLRFGLELVDLSERVRPSAFSVFESALTNGGQVKAVRYPGGASLSRKEVDDLGNFCKEFGAKGLATIAVTQLEPLEVKSAITKFLTEEQMQNILTEVQAETGDLICIIADPKPSVVANVLGRLRLEIGRRKGLRDPNVLQFAIITDFPLVQWDEEAQRWEAEHHPFTMPYEEHLPYFDTDPSKIRAQCYDLVCNGQESGSGSIRIHRADIQARVFDLLGISREKQQERFSHILEAFAFGAPPHGGFATGIDRLLMNLLDEPNIREVIAFPKMGFGYDPMMDAPSSVDDVQLQELGLRIVPRKKPEVR
ncbi:MAG: aspartyl-tRNA synthetase [Chthonomonadaceae bacterium]|nr:aspartyl-tRNA synthetase [Chthonomonadaceae bacterium]